MPAPEGLDESARFLLREFRSDDATVAAGLTGLLDWYDAEGRDLLGVEATAENADGFEVAPLAADDVAALPLEGERALERATGVIGLAELACEAGESEALQVRADQDVVFDGEWSHYEREFITSRQDFAARAEPFLETSNALGTDDAGVLLDYTLVLHFRHGTWDVQGEAREATLVQTWLPERADGEDGTNSIEQVYGIDALVAQADGGTLRLVASWTDVVSPWLPDDDPSLLISASVRRIQRFADRLSDVCSGEVALPPE